MGNEKINEKINAVIMGERRCYPAGTTYEQAAKEFQDRMKYRIVLADADGRLRELGHEIQDGETVKFLTVAEKAGRSTYIRSLLLVMLKAIYRVAGDNRRIERVGVHFIVSGGCYCTMKGEAVLDRGRRASNQKVLGSHVRGG